ncbi:MAG TPA: hypothetical protein VEB21_07150, partial [Terriglobales bacterium]|nr:hypothetical protein [Terriglobales bacterium]
ALRTTETRMPLTVGACASVVILAFHQFKCSLGNRRIIAEHRGDRLSYLLRLHDVAAPVVLCWF